MGWDDAGTWTAHDSAGAALVLLAASLWWVAFSIAGGVLAVYAGATSRVRRAAEGADDL